MTPTRRGFQLSRRWGSLTGALVLSLLGPANAHAMFAMPELETVPVERLVKNVERKIAADPGNIQWRYALARLYSMAYARRRATAETTKTQPPWDAFGQSAPGLPYFSPTWEPWRGTSWWEEREAQAVDDRQAAEWLDRAIEAYDAALRVDASHGASRMGRAWCVEQAGRIPEAVAAYRFAFEQAWLSESEKERLGISEPSLCVEAGSALLRLLPEDAAEERAFLQRRMAFINRQPMAITPLMIPLDSSATHRGDLAPGGAIGPRAPFDLIGGGQPATWEWLTGRAGWLVWDPRRTGVVRTGRQLFGSTTWWIFWTDGFQPLALLDDDQNGWLEGEELDGLAVWQDRNGNGLSEPGEVRPLSVWGIAALACTFRDRADGALVHPEGVRFRDGHRRALYDWMPRRLSRLIELAPTSSQPVPAWRFFQLRHAPRTLTLP